jgi:Ca2+-transporting ATPase
MITTGVALAFAVIPEELPIVITMVLGIGSYNLSKQNLLIKKMRATESLANATVIVTDKTGTLTEGKMKIVDVYPQPQQIVLQIAALCISEYALSPLDREILQRARESGSLNLTAIVRERMFGGNNQKSKAIIRTNGNIPMLYKSGAPEEIFASCSETPAGAINELDKQTKTGRRVIGVAFKELKKEDINKDFSELEKAMTFWLWQVYARSWSLAIIPLPRLLLPARLGYLIKR